MRKVNPCGKRREINEPYEVWKSLNGKWEWRVLKKYQLPEKEVRNPYAKWFCAVKTPYVSDWELGDAYVKDVRFYAYLQRR